MFGAFYDTQAKTPVPGSQRGSELKGNGISLSPLSLCCRYKSEAENLAYWGVSKVVQMTSSFLAEKKTQLKYWWGNQSPARDPATKGGAK